MNLLTPALHAGRLFACFLLFGLVLTAGADTAFSFDISGRYKGFFQYYDAKRNNVVGHFEIEIQHDGSRITGTIKEPRTDFGPQKPFLYSDFAGTVSGNENAFSIQYTKTYRYDRHTVEYQGDYRAYVGEIQGEWNIGTYKGNFKISNINPLPEIDIEPPQILLIKPDYVSTVGGTRAIEVVERPGHRKIEILGFASDNVKVDSVLINGKRADLSAPTESEKNVLRGNTVKFSDHVDSGSGGPPITVEAIDLQKNSNKLQFSLQTAEAAGSGRQGVFEASGPLYGTKVAVVIGIDRYVSWPALEFAVNDAASVERFLKAKGYQTVMLLDHDATRANILKTLGYELPSMVGNTDSVLIYFAGHGHTESLRDGGKEGYIVPVDAGATDCFLSAISMRQLKSITQRIKARHILFLMDSCYSGLGFSRSGGITGSETDYIKKVTAYRAVQMITAGGMNEQVLEDKGHGIFTRNLLKALEGTADLDKDGYITGSELGVYLRSSVTKASGSRQTPNYGRFEGEGEYVFRIEK